MYQGVVAVQIVEGVEAEAAVDEEYLVLWEEDQEEEVEVEAEAMKLPNLNLEALEALEVEEVKAEMQVYQKH